MEFVKLRIDLPELTLILRNISSRRLVRILSRLSVILTKVIGLLASRVVM